MIRVEHQLQDLNCERLSKRPVASGLRGLDQVIMRGKSLIGWHQFSGRAQDRTRVRAAIRTSDGVAADVWPSFLFAWMETSRLKAHLISMATRGKLCF